MNSPQNLAARAGRWSARHRKTAILGWIALVVAATMIGSSVGTETLSDAEYGVGESGEADKVLADAFPEETDEVVLVESDEARPRRAPEFRAVVDEVTPSSRASRASARSRARTTRPPAAASPRTGTPPLVNFELPGAPTTRPPTPPRRPSPRSTASPRSQPRLLRRRVRRRERQRADRQRVRGGLPAGRVHLAADHADHPRPRVRRPRGRGHPAAPRRHLRRHRPRPDGSAQPDLPGRRGRVVGDPADRPRRRRRLHDVLPAPRTRGTRARAAAPRRRSTPPRRRPDGPCWSRASRC